MTSSLAKPESPHDVSTQLEQAGYVTDEALATTIFLLQRLERPVLLEGPSGVGKTELAQALATTLGTELIRLQCYEGLDVHSAVYEWNYQKQLLAIRMEGDPSSLQARQQQIFSDDYLLERPLLKAIRCAKAPVLLIDEVDRADEEFEAFLLELLSAFQITIPELGTLAAQQRPYVLLTSNRTRELSDALKRRCLYHWIDYPTLAKEQAIVRKRLPHIDAELARQTVQCVQSLRELRLNKAPGVAETLDWAQALLALHRPHLGEATFERTLGCVLKSTEDMETVRRHGLATLLEEQVA
jgi:MoxR-like ATPase